MGDFSKDFSGLGFTLPKLGPKIPKPKAPVKVPTPTTPIAKVPFWNNNPRIWDNVSLGIFDVSPGVVSKIEIDRSVKWDKKDGPGVDLCYTTYQGDSPAQLAIELTMWRDTHIDLARKLIAYLFAKSLIKTKPRSPISVVHPWVVIHGLDLFVVDSVKTSHPKADGISTMSIELTQWGKPPKTPVTVTPTGDALARGGVAGAAALGVSLPSETYPKAPLGVPKR